MGKNGKLKRQMEAELAPVPKVAIFVAAGVCVGLGILFALCCIERYVYFYTLQPRGHLSPFLSAVFWCMAYAVYGGSAALFFAGRYRCERGHFEVAVPLLCVPVLCYVWLPMIYKAACFFLGALLAAVALFCVAVLISNALRRSRLAALGFSLFSLWMLYILYYSFALFLLN